MNRIDLSVLRKNIDMNKGHLFSLRKNREDAARTNEQLTTLEEDERKLEKVVIYLENTLNAVVRINRRAIAEDIAYKDRRVSFIEEVVTENLAHVYPENKLRAVIDNDFKNRGSHAELLLYDEDGNEMIPYIQEGGMYQSVISFSSAIGITVSTGRATLWLDEPFAAGSPTKIALTAELIYEALKQGLQLILIEQSDAGYKNIIRREHHWYKNPRTKAVEVIKVSDYEEVI